MSDSSSIASTVKSLLQRGVRIPLPDTVYVDESVIPERIAAGVVLHPGTRLSGDTLSIGPGCEIGSETPATLDDCQLAHNVLVKGGYLHGAVLLDGVEVGSGAHIRPGTLLEEKASAAHNVGLKQTILLSYVTAGSLINFCDCLMAGGTSRKRHSEIGSSYIHFNFTPHGDKATPSLLGDVARGVLLNQLPIFLGGQGGLVGPVRVEYGVVIAAGAIQRKDALRAGHLYGGDGVPDTKPRPYSTAYYGGIDRLVRNNIIYMGNIQALQVWYRHARSRFMRACPFREACRIGALNQLDVVLQERIRRMQKLVESLPASIEALEAQANESDHKKQWIVQQQRWMDAWEEIRDRMKRPVPADVGADQRDRFLTIWSGLDEDKHLDAIHALPDEGKQAATAWLQAIVDNAAKDWSE